MEKLKSPAEAASHQSTTESPEPLKKLTVLQCMKVLFSSYRVDQYSDPEGFKVNIGLVLEQYPDETIRFVTDPRTGVQRRCAWPPSVKEVVDACDAHMQHKANVERFKNWGGPHRGSGPLGREQIEAPREKRPTLEELHAKHGKDWGIGISPTDAQLREHMKTLPVGSRWTMKQVVDDWRTKHGVDLGLSDGDGPTAIDPKPAPTWDGIVDHYRNNPSEMERLTGALMTRYAK